MCKLVPKPLYAILHKWTRHNYFSVKVIAMKMKTYIYIGIIFTCSKYGVCSLKNRDIQSGEQGSGCSTRLPILGERQEAQILKFNAPPPTHLVCHVHLIANFISFYMSLVVVVNSGAGNALRGFEISIFYFFVKLYFIHISKDILLLWALNALKQCEWYFSRKP